MKVQLTKQAAIITEDKETNDSLIKEKIEQVQKQNKLIKEVRKE